MGVLTFEGVVKSGQIRLRNGEQLPENATVYVVMPNVAEDERAVYPVTIPANPRILSPRLVRKDGASHLSVEMTGDADAGV